MRRETVLRFVASTEPRFLGRGDVGRERQREFRLHASTEPRFLGRGDRRIFHALLLKLTLQRSRAF